jgi:hypothetical protein
MAVCTGAVPAANIPPLAIVGYDTGSGMLQDFIARSLCSICDHLPRGLGLVTLAANHPNA